MAINTRAGSTFSGRALRCGIFGGVTLGRPKKTVTPLGVIAPLIVGTTNPLVPSANEVPAATGVVCSPSPRSVKSAPTLGNAIASLDELTGSMLVMYRSSRLINDAGCETSGETGHIPVTA